MRRGVVPARLVPNLFGNPAVFSAYGRCQTGGFATLAFAQVCQKSHIL